MKLKLLVVLFIPLLGYFGRAHAGNKTHLPEIIDRAFPPEMFAAAYGDVETLTRLLNRWPKPSDGANVMDWVEQTPLHLSAKFGKLETTRVLIANGANVNAKNRDFDETPLHLAAKSGYLEVVRLLLGHGADVNAEIKQKTVAFQGGTPMTYAIETANSLDTAGALVFHGADVNLPNLDKATPLHLAVRNQNLALAKFLIEYGADIEAKDHMGRSPLNYLVSTRQFSPQLALIAFLLNHRADLESKDRFDRTSFHVALTKGHRAVAKFLLQEGADINSRSKAGRTILRRIVVSNRLTDKTVDIVRFLLRNGANATMGSSGSNCDTPLVALVMAAANCSIDDYVKAKRHYAEIAELLIRYGADPYKVSTCSNLTALEMANRSNLSDLAKRMIQFKFALGVMEFEEADPSVLELSNTFAHIGVDSLEKIVVMMSKFPKNATAQRDWLNQTALHVASFFGRAYVAMSLSCFGYDIHATDVFRKTPLHHASSFGKIVLMDYLLDRKAGIETPDGQGFTPLLVAVKYANSPEVVRHLLNRGANVTARTYDGRTALHLAAENQNLEVMEILLASNVSANIKSGHGETVLNYLLHSRCCYPQIPTVGILLKHGADVNEPDMAGHTPLHGVIRSKKNIEVMLLLLHHGADPNKADNRGCNTPLHQYLRLTADDKHTSDEDMAKAIKWLVAFGADPNHPDPCYHRLTPMLLAKRSNRRLAEKAMLGE